LGCLTGAGRPAMELDQLACLLCAGIILFLALILSGGI
jgi:hypothetical protein